MGITLTQLTTGKIEVSGVNNRYLIDDTLSAKEANVGVALINNQGIGQFTFIPLGVDPEGGVEKVIEYDGTEHEITDQASLFDAFKIVFRSAGGSARKTLVTELVAISPLANQYPDGFDNPLQFTFGAAQNTIDDAVMLSAAGLITFNKPDNYILLLEGHFGRDGQAQVSQLRAASFINGVNTGLTIGARIQSVGITIPFSLSANTFRERGDTLHYEILRDSGGHDSGGLLRSSVTMAGWVDGSCVRIIIQRLTN